MKKFRIGILGLHHDHIWSNLQELLAQANAEVVAAADPNPPLLEKISGVTPCATYSDYEELLDKEEVNAVYVFGNNRVGAELSVNALGRGLHVLVEKPMAADLAGADAMLAAAGESGARLMINWPFAWWPQLGKAIEMARDGVLGRLWQVKYRAAHQGPRELGCSEFFCEWLYDAHLNGAGAFMDYCCYGSVLARVLLGQPESVTGFKERLCKEDLRVDDNAMLFLRYSNAIATSEGSWTQIGKLTAYTTAIYGEQGTLLVEPRGGGRLLHATLENEEGVEVPVPEPEPHLRSGSANFLWGIETGEPFHPLCEAQASRDAQAILEAGLESCEEGRAVRL